MQITETTDLKKIQEFMGKGYTLSDAREMRDVLIANGINDTETANPSTIRDCVSMAISGPGPIIGDERSYEHDPRDEPEVFFGVTEYPKFLNADALANGEKKRFVVIDEDKFGFIDPRQPNGVVLLSAPASPHYGKPVNDQGLRPAVFEDFEKFRVSTGGYEEDPSFDFPHPKDVELYMLCDGHAGVAKIPRTEYLKHADEIGFEFRNTVMRDEDPILTALMPVECFKLNRQHSGKGAFWHRAVIEGEPHFTILPLEDSTPGQVAAIERGLRTYHGDCAKFRVVEPKHWVSPLLSGIIQHTLASADLPKQPNTSLAFVVDAISKSPATPGPDMG